MSIPCEGCMGTGVRVPATPSCTIETDERLIVIERCDLCERFEDDYTAACSVYSDVRLVQCLNGGLHAVTASQVGVRALAP
jgi:hypothetical protein